MSTKYKHFTLEERKYIEKMYKTEPISHIARTLDRAIISINRELDRCEKGKYDAKAANQDALKKKRTRSVNTAKNSAEKRKRKYISMIRACIRLNPNADVYEISQATEIPYEIVEQYYSEVKHTECL